MEEKDRLYYEKGEVMCNNEIEACIKSVKNGNRDAFEFIVTTYQRPLYKYIRYIVYNQWDTDDIVQDVFIKIYTQLNQYKPNTNFEGWIYRIAYNHTMSVLKKKAKEPILLVDSVPDVAYLDEYKSEPSSEIYKTLEKLTHDERAILFLRIHEDLSYKVMGKIVKKNDGLLRKKFERAKKRFIKFYKEVSEDEKRRIQSNN